MTVRTSPSATAETTVPRQRHNEQWQHLGSTSRSGKSNGNESTLQWHAKRCFYRLLRIHFPWPFNSRWYHQTINLGRWTRIVKTTPSKSWKIFHYTFKYWLCLHSELPFSFFHDDMQGHIRRQETARKAILFQSEKMKPAYCRLAFLTLIFTK